MVDRSRWAAVRIGLLWGVVVIGGIGQAHAELIDRVDVRKAGNEAEIVIRFSTRVQYQRHAPKTKGGLLQLFLIQPGVLSTVTSPVPESLTQAAPGLVKPFTLNYPDLNGALSIRFYDPTTWRVKPGKDQRSISIFVPISVKPAEPPARPPEVAKPEPAAPEVAKPAKVIISQTPPAWEKDARGLMDQVKAAARRGDHVAAIELLNRLLNLPPNAFSEEAQMMIGEEREANGETARAIAEYNLYIKLYPEGAYALQARKRLAALAQAAPPEAKEGRPEVARKEYDTGWELYGSLAQNYYAGNSHIEILTAPPPGELTFDQQTLDQTDQSALVTSLDVTYRRRTTDVDQRFVLRDTDTRNFLSGVADRNRLNAAYYERNDKAKGYLVRLGRQTASSGGVLGRFDGVWGGYNLSPSLRANATAGYLVEYDVDWEKTFAGISLDMIPQPEKITGSAYAIAQRVDDLDDRQAVGVEVRYFDSKSNYFGLLDYDTMFGEINIAMLQGNYQTENGYNLFFLLDHRKSPILQLTNATPGLQQGSLKAALASGVGMDQLRDKALLKTADADLYQIGFTHQYTPRLQFGADYRLAVISDSQQEDPTTGTLSLAPGTGNIHVYSVQFIGNSLLKENDVGVANLSYIQAPAYDGTSVSLSHVLNLERWRIDSILGYYRQEDDSGTDLTRWSPIFRVSYRLRDNWYIESELGMEDSVTTQLSGSEDRTRRTYFFIGYRWEW